MKDITIRELSQTDAADVARIHTAITQIDDQKEYEEMVVEQCQRKDDASFVAVLEDQVVGYLIGHILSGGFGIKKSAWIAALGVAPEHMGQGIGENLANHFFNASKKCDIAHVYTTVRWDSPDLLSFFKRLDFQKSNFINLLKRI